MDVVIENSVNLALRILEMTLRCGTLSYPCMHIQKLTRASYLESAYLYSQQGTVSVGSLQPVI